MTKGILGAARITGEGRRGPGPDPAKSFLVRVSCFIAATPGHQIAAVAGRIIEAFHYLHHPANHRLSDLGTIERTDLALFGFGQRRGRVGVTMPPLPRPPTNAGPPTWPAAQRWTWVAAC